MVLSEKETAAIKDLQTQEQTCIEKYGRYSTEAKDPVLVNLFTDLKKKEQQHYDSLGQVLSGTVPKCNVNDSHGKEYSPTQRVGTEKLVSSEYNSDVFVFSDPDVRKLLADIQVEEQNHAEMLYKYKTANSMS